MIGNERTTGFVAKHRARLNEPRARLTVVIAFVVAALGLAWQPLARLIGGGHSEYYSHIVLIPFVTAYFFFTDRTEIADGAKSSWVAGGALGLVGLLIHAVALWQKEWLGANDFASMTSGAAVVFLWGGFLLAYGTRAWKTARFALLFLLFVIPVPDFLLHGFISLLQIGSTEVTQWLFDLTGTAYVRNGFDYQLTGIAIRVAEECSGIRSSLALIITGVLAGHLFLESGWRTFILLVALVPITVFKNGVRIVTLSLLAIHVDTKFITDSFLHHSGGFIFYIPGLALMGLMIWLLRKGRTSGKNGRMEG
jgi:exosortase